ncbi:alpha-ketoacid dehydrogenase subunit alpha/beta [Adhaeribacter radiodurans]|uniref:3-methyl-2-oxobutanoate dehydrogenase (2-methylpropanoyl-transferring) n=1 Tax=Adhaeribacter radiodurans TaxID=2745197 RepID=A0A7L7L854_9BACT|nr:alpha-ketoacid dehydrogenase subunit alpha/beta [Adhaeribacter radiodurans]QMU28715.1 tungsten formylmethanofuran dehydrogenase [Adhaeribacter radiodurans]
MANITQPKSLELYLKILLQAYSRMLTARAMANTYEQNRQICRYVHSTSRGHEAIQLATAFQLSGHDYACLYYRDEAMLLGLGFTPYELMLQLLAKADDPFSGGRIYYGHPSVRREGLPIIPHQSSATGMQAIPATGMSHAIRFLEAQGIIPLERQSVVLCSLGDGAVTEGEVSEALQMAVLKQLPIIYLVQDNDWGISAKGSEMRAMDAYEFAQGFKGLERMRIDGSDFVHSFTGMKRAFNYARQERKPILVHAKCPLLGHHTSGVRKEWYRGESIELALKNDPIPKLQAQLVEAGETIAQLEEIEQEILQLVAEAFSRAVIAPEPDPTTIYQHDFAPTPIVQESGTRHPIGAAKVTMVDAALHAIEEILKDYPEALFYGQDVGKQLGGVFREAALLAAKYGDERVFNTPIQEAYIIGSTAGMAAVGAKPIVEIQFADYMWPGLNQLVEELSKSCYLTQGKFPVQCLIRVPIGAYGGGGPYHSGSIESALLTIRGIKVVYPSNAADMKGLMKAAFLDPNPVVFLEHKGLYWSKLPGTEEAKSYEPAADYIVPLGQPCQVVNADLDKKMQGESLVVITYGMGIYWAREAAKGFKGQIEIIDLRTLYPLNEAFLEEAIQRHGKALLLTEEPLLNSFIESLAGRLSQKCFRYLDAPILTLGSENVPAVPLNICLESKMLPNADKVAKAINHLLHY